MVDSHPLDNPARAALLGPQAHLAERLGAALRYRADISPFIGLPDQPGPDAWDDLARLTGPGAVVSTAGVAAEPPTSWDVLMRLDGVQLVADGVAGVADTNAVSLGPADVPEMLDLTKRTRPGPFLARTIEFGGYLGIRRNGALAAMAGERLRTPGWTEVSAVCTAPEFRGQGLGTRLTLAVMAAIRDRGDVPFLHAAADNESAIRLYSALGFRLRRQAVFVVVRTPKDIRPLDTGRTPL
jgi:ribosomal protein S18 acetylase RimI-like enzyme